MRLRSGRQACDFGAESETHKSHKRNVFSLLALPAEIRQMIYHAVFAQRGIVIRASRSQQWPPQYLLEFPTTTDSAVGLLQSCKLVYAEAHMLIALYIPTDLIITSHLGDHPVGQDQLEDCGLPAGFVSRLTVRAATLRDLRKATSVCGARAKTWASRMSPSLMPPRGYSNYSQPNNILGIRRLRSGFINQFPAWKEFHIYNILGQDLGTTVDTCKCVLAKTKLCSCGRCKCRCIQFPDLLLPSYMSRTEVKSHLYDAILPRFREAMPKQGLWNDWPRPHQGQASIAMLHILGCGIEIVFHDEVFLSTTLDTRQTMHKGHWKVTYRLNPPKDANKPVNPPQYWAPILKRRGGNDQKDLNEQGRSVQGNPGDAGTSTGTGSRFPTFDRKHKEYRNFMADHSDRRPGPSIYQLLAEYSTTPDKSKFDLPRLIDFEAAKLQIELLDEDDFDTIFDTESKVYANFKTKLEESKIWRW